MYEIDGGILDIKMLCKGKNGAKATLLIKIDGQFIRDIITVPLDDVAVRCFLDVARVIGVKTVAEFVDKPEVLDARIA